MAGKGSLSSKSKKLKELAAGCTAMGIQELHGDICSQCELAKQLSNSHFVGWSNLHEETVHDSENSAHFFHHAQADACSSSSSSDESSKSVLSQTSCSSGNSLFSCSAVGPLAT